MTDPMTETTRGDCPNCERQDVDLVDTTDSDWVDSNKVCGYCIKKHGDRVYHEAERAKRRQSDLGNARNINYEQH